jgi:hypothetical protein
VPIASSGPKVQPMVRGYIFHQAPPSRNVQDVKDFGIAARYEDIQFSTWRGRLRAC